MEIWLRTNPRPFLVALSAALLLALAGGVWGWVAPGLIGIGWIGWLGWVVMVLGLLAAAALAWNARSPILGFEKGNFLLYLGTAKPIAIPLEVVECFFSGQGDAMIRDRTGKELEVSAIIFRLAESAQEWHHRDVPARFAHWCEGYITVRGTWCEPIGPDLLRKLNQRLVAAQRAAKEAKA